MEQHRKELAKQFVTYADAITAFSFVQSAAFGFALAQHEIRDSVLKASGKAKMVTFAAYVIYVVVVVVCWFANGSLSPLPKEDKQTRIFARALWLGRLAIIVLGATLCLLAICWTVEGSAHPAFPM